MDISAGSDMALRRQNGLLKARPAVYIVILLGAFLASFVYNLRVDSIFACQATGYTSDRFLAYCEAKNYGDYEHGAFWFNLEPAATRSAASADVLFLGNSRVQFAFSTAATAQWFSSASASDYVLGFIGFENSIFARALLKKLKPRARVYVIAIGGFFEPTERVIAKKVMHNHAARTQYEDNRTLQFVHEAICMTLSSICGNNLAIFRSRQNGAWYMPQSRQFAGHELPVSYDQQIDKREIDDAIAIGRIFLSDLPAKPDCVILTAIPHVDTKLDESNAIASGLGKTLVVPEHLDGLQTFDGIHLDPASAERWSEAFLKAAGPQIQKCLEVSASR